MELQTRHRNAELTAKLTLAAHPGTHRIDTTLTTYGTHATTPDTIRRTITELTTDGIIRTKRNRNGTITAHALTTLGLAWWQGRTTLPVPRYNGTSWQWWTPQPHDLLELPSGGHGFTPDHHVDEDPHLQRIDDLTQDDDATIAALLDAYQQRKPGLIDPPPPETPPT